MTEQTPPKSSPTRGLLTLEAILAVEIEIPNAILDKEAKPPFDEVTVAFITSIRDAVVASLGQPVTIKLKDREIAARLSAGGPGDIRFLPYDAEVQEIGQ